MFTACASPDIFRVSPEFTLFLRQEKLPIINMSFDE